MERKGPALQEALQKWQKEPTRKAKTVVLEAMVAILEQNGAVPRAHKGDYEGGYLKGTYIYGMSFLKANLMVANFRSADREGAEIHESYLIDTNFQGANLHKATIKASLANLSQKEAFGKVMTEEQINALVWL